MKRGTQSLLPIRCVTCHRHLASFAMRARCVFECGAWYCRRGEECRHKHAREACPNTADLRSEWPD